MLILTKETNPVVRMRARKLGLNCHGSEDNKARFLDEWLRKSPHHATQDPWDGLIYLGNDLNDLECIERASCSVAPRNAHPRVRQVASVVLDSKGGEGFVRHFLELLLQVENMEAEEILQLV